MLNIFFFLGHFFQSVGDKTSYVFWTPFQLVRDTIFRLLRTQFLSCLGYHFQFVGTPFLVCQRYHFEYFFRMLILVCLEHHYQGVRDTNYNVFGLWNIIFSIVEDPFLVCQGHHFLCLWDTIFSLFGTSCNLIFSMGLLYLFLH